MMALAECGTSVVWSGTDLQRFYAAGIGKSRSSQTILKQAVAWANEDSRMDVVKRLYRFRFAEELPDDLTLQQIRGHEGVRVRDAYSQASNRFGIDWQGRNYSRDDWTTADPANRALSAGATCLYGVCHGAIMARGYSPAIGFIHHGKQLSFVYDIADLYKVEILIPAAFEVAASGERSVERATRTLLRERMHQAKLLDRAVYDLDRLFVEVTKGIAVADLDADDAPGGLWDPTGIVEGGKNYGGDDA